MTPRTRFFLLATLIALLATVGGWQGMRASQRQAAEIATLVQRTSRQRGELQRLQAERAAARANAAETSAAATPAFATGDAGFDRQMATTLSRLSQLRTWLEQHPGEKIPEFQFLRDIDWIDAVTDEGDPHWSASRRALAREGHVVDEAEGEKEFDPRRSARDLRGQARGNLAQLLHAAFRSYAEANEGRLPANLAELAPFTVFPIPATVLQRYELRATGLLSAVPRDLPILGERAEAITAEGDRPLVYFPRQSWGMELFRDSPFLYAPESSPEVAIALSKANQAYRTAHSGRHPKDFADLMPHFENPVLVAELVETRTAKDIISRAVEEGMRGYAAAHGGRAVDPANRADMLPYVSDPSARAILAAKDAYLAATGKHAENSAVLRPHVTDPAARALLDKLIRGEAGRAR